MSKSSITILQDIWHLQTRDGRIIDAELSFCRNLKTYGLYVKPKGGDSSQKTYDHTLCLNELLRKLKDDGISEIIVFWAHGNSRNDYINIHPEQLSYNINDIDDCVEKIKKNLNGITHPSTFKTSGSTSPIYLESMLITKEFIKKLFCCKSHFHSIWENFKDSYGIDVRLARIICIRRGQPKFREKLVEKYKKCPISGCDTIDVLEAAHVIPYSKKGNYEVQNGILLRADIHTIFDLGYIDIEYNKNEDKFFLKLNNENLSQDSYYKEILKNGKEIEIPLSINRRKLGENLFQRIKIRNERKDDICGIE